MPYRFLCSRRLIPTARSSAAGVEEADGALAISWARASSTILAISVEYTATTSISALWDNFPQVHESSQLLLRGPLLFGSYLLLSET